MNGLAIDHIVVGARSLEEGAEFFSRTLGLRLEPGGKHDSMGTHNMLLRLGEACYLELIAIDPDAPQPPRPRLFGLDSEEVRQRLARGPRLLTWAVRTSDIAAAVERSGISLGEIASMRRGELRWRLTAPKDGAMPEAGIVPFFIEWATTPHPAGSMREADCALLRLEALHPEPERIADELRELGVAHLCAVGPAARRSAPTLRATLLTPAGPKLLA